MANKTEYALFKKKYKEEVLHPTIQEKMEDLLSKQLDIVPTPDGGARYRSPRQ